MTHPSQTWPHAVFFDLDGTLADTAADLAAPIHSMRAEKGLPPLDDGDLRPLASTGARGLIGRGLGLKPGDDSYEAVRVDFMQRYEAGMLERTRLFEGMHDVLSALDSAGVRWGVISNKIERLVVPIVAGLGLSARSVCVIGGDTTPHAKPHPAPLLHGAQLAGVDATACVYIGDDLRDIEAGRAAGMRTVAAAYGYCGSDHPPERWGADHLIREPRELIAWLALGRSGVGN
ncbi:MAG: HAD family hydrolase [Betaproteobacteria bacterium]